MVSEYKAFLGLLYTWKSQKKKLKLYWSTHLIHHMPLNSAVMSRTRNIKWLWIVCIFTDLLCMGFLQFFLTMFLSAACTEPLPAYWPCLYLPWELTLACLLTKYQPVCWPHHCLPVGLLGCLLMMSLPAPGTNPLPFCWAQHPSLTHLHVPLTTFTSVPPIICRQLYFCCKAEKSDTAPGNL